MRDDVTRREAMGKAAGVGLLGVIVPVVQAKAADRPADKVPRTK